MKGTNMENKELLPCPFCGREVTLEKLTSGFHRNITNYWITCAGCDLESPSKTTESEAIVAWNKRAENKNEYCYFCVGCKEPFRIFDEECEYCPKCGRKLE